MIRIPCTGYDKFIEDDRPFITIEEAGDGEVYIEFTEPLVDGAFGGWVKISDLQAAVQEFTA